MVRKASNAWALDIGTPATLSFFSSARSRRNANAATNVRPHPFGLLMNSECSIHQKVDEVSDPAIAGEGCYVMVDGRRVFGYESRVDADHCARDLDIGSELKLGTQPRPNHEQI